MPVRNVAIDQLVHIGRFHSGESAHLRFQPQTVDRFYRLEFPVGNYRETSLDNVYSQIIKSPCDLDFFLYGERNTGSLFSIAQSRVKNPDAPSRRHVIDLS